MLIETLLLGLLVGTYVNDLSLRVAFLVVNFVIISFVVGVEYTAVVVSFLITVE
jgi:hypothetical protein